MRLEQVGGGARNMRVCVPAQADFRRLEEKNRASLTVLSMRCGEGLFRARMGLGV